MNGQGSKGVRARVSNAEFDGSNHLRVSFIECLLTVHPGVNGCLVETAER